MVCGEPKVSVLLSNSMAIAKTVDGGIAKAVDVAVYTTCHSKKPYFFERCKMRPCPDGNRMSCGVHKCSFHAASELFIMSHVA